MPMKLVRDSPGEAAASVESWTADRDQHSLLRGLCPAPSPRARLDHHRAGWVVRTASPPRGRSHARAFLRTLLSRRPPAGRSRRRRADLFGYP
jgi:hypothetical protein